MRRLGCFWICLIALCAACESSSGIRCMEGAKICDESDNAAQCIDGELQVQICRKGCSRGRCLENDACSASDYPQCSDDASQILYCVDGQQTSLDCGAEKKCLDLPPNEPVCVPETLSGACKDGETRCHITGERQRCVSQRWKNDACQNGDICRRGRCVDKDVCENGERQCHGLKDIEICVDEQWRHETRCEARAICQNGVCTETDLMQPGDPCVAGETQEYCDTDNNRYFCGPDASNPGAFVFQMESCQKESKCMKYNDTFAACMFWREDVCERDGEYRYFVESCSDDDRTINFIYCREIDGKVYYHRYDAYESACFLGMEILQCQEDKAVYSYCQEDCFTDPQTRKAECLPLVAGNACPVDYFEPYCDTVTSMKSCENGVIVSRACPENTKCQLGHCVDMDTLPVLQTRCVPGNAQFGKTYCSDTKAYLCGGPFYSVFSIDVEKGEFCELDGENMKYYQFPDWDRENYVALVDPECNMSDSRILTAVGSTKNGKIYARTEFLEAACTNYDGSSDKLDALISCEGFKQPKRVKCPNGCEFNRETNEVRCL